MRDYLVFLEQAVYDSPVAPYVLDQNMLGSVYLTPSPLRCGEQIYMFITHVVNPTEIYAQIVSYIHCCPSAVSCQTVLYWSLIAQYSLCDVL